MNVRRILRSISLLWLGAVLGAFFAFLTQALLARALGVHGYGSFASALAFITVLAPIAGFGVPGFWLRVFGEEGRSALRWIRPSLYFLLSSSLSLFAGIMLWAVFLEPSPNSSEILKILSFYIFGQVSTELCISKAQLSGRYAEVAAWQMLPHLLRLVIVAILVQVATDTVTPMYVAYCYSFLSLCVACVSFFNINKILNGKVHLAGHDFGSTVNYSVVKPAVYNVFKGALPYGMVGLLYLLYFQSSVVLLGRMSGPVAAGAFNVAFVVLSAVYLFPNVIYQKFMMPMIQRWSYHDVAHSYYIFKLGSLLMLVIGLLAAGIVLLLTPRYLPFIFGEEFSTSVPILMSLAVCIPLRFVSSSSGAFLSAGAHVKAKIKIMSAAAVLNLTLGAYLISAYGVDGAVYSMITVEITLLVCFTLYVWLKVFGGFRGSKHAG